MLVARLSLRAGGWVPGPACSTWKWRGWGRRGQAAIGPQTRDLGGSCPRGQARAGGREARAGLGFAVAVPVAVYLDTAAGQAGQEVAAVRLGQRGEEAGGGRRCGRR
jgi:hypothetical protein